MINNFIFYSVGSYGVFVDWCINNLTKQCTVDDLPFKPTGSSHNHPANMLFEINEHDNYFSAVGTTTHYVELFHNKPNINNLVIMLAKEEDEVWRISNYIEKEEKTSSVFLPINYQDANPTLDYLDRRTLQHFGRTDLLGMDRWQAREILSFGILDKFRDNIAQQNLMIDNLSYNKLVVYINELRDNFSATVKKIFDFCDLKLYDTNFLHKVGTEWSSKQKYMHKNRPHTLLSEAVKQAELRQKGIELKCYGLNKFPSSDNALTKFFI